MDLQATIRDNMQALRGNPYPGRGIVIGCTPDGTRLLQVYWIMGRSENSRNRTFVRDGDTVRTALHDASKVEDPSLIIYNCARVAGRAHIVTNGDQTDTIHDALVAGRTFEQALYSRTFEPDAPNYTPRISGIAHLETGDHVYQLCVLKPIDNDPQTGVRCVYSYATAIPGVGHFISTYSGDGKPLPAFASEPRPVELTDSAEETLGLYWAALNEANRVSLMVKFIDRKSGAVAIHIVNKHV